MDKLFAPNTAPMLLALASITALAAAFISQYGFDLQPCVLCIYQRWPYAIVIALCLLVVVPGLRQRTPWLLALCALALAVNAGIAAYHVGVEQHWWAGSEACVGAGGTPQTLDALRAQIMNTPVIRCDEVAFSLFGVSMAGYNVLFSLALAIYAGLAGASVWKRMAVT